MDLLHIQDILGPPPPTIAPKTTTQGDDDEDIASSGSNSTLSSLSSDSDGSDSDEGSANEVEKLVLVGDGKSPTGATLPDDSSNSDSDSDSDSEPNPQIPAVVMKKPQLPREFEDDDEGGGPSTQNAAQGYKSTNEKVETDAQILVPDVSSVGPHEVLEHVGEIMSVLDRSIIIRGAASAQAVNARALDAGSLLVFDDRQVLGHIHETFGPTYQPFYVIKFRSTHPSLLAPIVPTTPSSDDSKLSAVPPTVGPETLDAEPTSDTVRIEDASMATSNLTADAVSVPETEIVMPSSPAPIIARAPEPLPSPYVVSRHVFHVPERSNFVFIEKLKQQKGSDASNLHDEEPAGNDQLDFSDDEEEARYKRSLKGAGEKRKRDESMAPGQVWRGQTPSQMHDQDLSLSENSGSTPFYGSNPYDAHGPYDTGFIGGPPPDSGRTLMAYDDPYANSNDPMNAAQVSTVIDELIASSTGEPSTSGPSTAPSASNSIRPPRGRGRGGFSGGERGRGGGSAGERGRGRGRGRGADSRGRGRGRGGMQQHDRGDAQQYERRSSVSSQSAPIVQHRELSPTSLAIARATGQHMDGTSFAPAPTAGHMQMHPPAWGFGAPGAGQQQYGYGFHQAPNGHGWSQPQPPPPPQQQPMQQGFVQPHINPRFAAQWGWNMQNGGWQPPPGGDHQQGGGGTQ